MAKYRIPKGFQTQKINIEKLPRYMEKPKPFSITT